MLVGLGQMQQGARESLLTRCLQIDDPIAGLKFLKRIKFNFRNLDFATISERAGCENEQVLGYLEKLG